VRVEYAHESQAPTSVCIGHALARGGSVATRPVIGGGEAREGKGEECVGLGSLKGTKI
jgi:hypothetical protein